MTPCPMCQKPVDPLRARAVGVRNGKVVAYCSAGCAAEDEVAGAAASVGLATKRTRTPSTSAGTKKLSRRRRDSLDAKAAWDWLDDEPAELGSGPVATGRRPLVTVLILVAVLVVLAGGYVAYRLA
jgi:hypothetical protein